MKCDGVCDRCTFEFCKDTNINPGGNDVICEQNVKMLEDFIECDDPYYFSYFRGW